MKKTLIRSGFAVAVGWWAARQLSTIFKDISRYNDMRTMSGDAPLSGGQVREALFPSTAPGPTRYGANAKPPGLIPFLASIPQDIGRYLKMSSM